MDRYGSATNRLAAGEQYFLDTVVEYGRLAPQKLALDEFHQRALADAARARLLKHGSPAPKGMPLAGRLRQRLGRSLILLGARLQGTPAASPAPSG